MVKHLIAAIALCVGIGIGPASAQPVDLPTPEALFEAHARAIGVETVVTTGGIIEAYAHVTVTGPEEPYEYDTEVKGTVTPEGLGDASFTMIRDGQSVTYGETDGQIWFEASDGARRDLSPVMAAFVRGHQFHRRVMYPALEFGSLDREVTSSEFGDRPVFKVHGTTPTGAQLIYYFDQREKHMIGFHLTVEQNGQPRPMEFTLRDWRTAGDQSLFRRIDVADADKIYSYRYTRILLLPN